MLKELLLTQEEINAMGWSGDVGHLCRDVAKAQLTKALNLFKAEVDKLTVIDDETAKEEVLKYHCSPETTKRDIIITDIEFDLMSLQLQRTKKQLLSSIGE